MYRVFSRINPKELNDALIRWTAGFNQSVEGKAIAIDGKTLRGSFDTATGKSALHMISAWVEENSLILGQVAVDEKTMRLPRFLSCCACSSLKGSLLPLMPLDARKI